MHNSIFPEKSYFTRFNYPHMRILFLSLILLLSGVCVPAFQADTASQCRLRVMDARELTVQADLISRVRVKKVKAIRDPMYGQLVTLEILEILKGDTRLKEVTVWAASKVYCAMDIYVKGQEFLVFLTYEQTLYRTLNWQYGQFLMGEPTIKGWRTPGTDPNAIPEKTFEQIKAEIQTFLEDARNPNGEPSPNGNPPPLPQRP